MMQAQARVAGSASACFDQHGGSIWIDCLNFCPPLPFSEGKKREKERVVDGYDFDVSCLIHHAGVLNTVSGSAFALIAC